MSLLPILLPVLFLNLAQPTRDIQSLLTKKTSLQWLQNASLPFNQSNPYCSVCCVDVNQRYRGRKCGIHTMCAYEAKKVGPACQGLIVMEFTRDEIDRIVDAHNTLRNRMAMGLEPEGDPGPQPTAANMKLISWDQELANVGARWATQCVFAHDKCRDLARFPVGQNLGWGMYASKSDLQHVADWYELVQYSNGEILASYDVTTQDLAPFTQLIWADTYLVGCARVSFQRQENGETVYREHFFCNYGPSGNIPGQAVYKVGEPCSACPEGTFCTDPEYPGLCGSALGGPDWRNRTKKHSKQMESSNAQRVHFGFLLASSMYFVAAP
ncbi:venom allergen 3-like [Dendroctonus ponderosae]|uniref:venom allergen 3-like n=1 Tax=Dendroctonus ponderosae TaxID=77166 RepID=UPI00203662A1|nr:venom allergen 3-like [Dendroctonus ponderosae]XP_048521533.1 venom allergen 3-like [Dendroctonus ponderosae]KAH1018289.1 hypothetical protein HUJ05_006090 [Dendroctonus ponderosae]